MASNLSGVPKAVIEVVDKSLLFQRDSTSNICLLGITSRGEMNKPAYVRNRVEFLRAFGGEVAGNKFAVYCMRILDAGGRLWVSRVGHYTNIADATTKTGTKASATITVGSDSVVFQAKEVGAGYNGSVIKVIAASSGKAAHFDIQVTAKDSDSTDIVVDVPAAPTAAQIAEFNLKLKHVNIGTVTNSIVLGTGTLASGVFDITTLVDTDYIGNSVQKLGWYSFGSVTNALRIANIDRPSGAVDVGLATYVNTRNDMRFHVAAPIGLSPSGAEDYRKGNAPYSYTPIDDWKGSLWAGQVNINSETDSTVKYDIPGIVDYLGRRAQTDTEFGPWISAAGFKRGRVKAPNNGVGSENFLDPSNADAADSAFTEGVNAIVDDPTYKTTVWGNKSLQANRGSLLNKENVADLAMYIKRRLEPMVRTELFEPNDPIMWKQVYRNVLPFLEKELEAGRAIVPGEGKNWFWIGDQDVDVREDATYNQQSDIDNGIYKVRFVFIPITATEFIGIEVTVTDSGSVSAIVEV